MAPSLRSRDRFSEKGIRVQKPVRREILCLLLAVGFTGLALFGLGPGAHGALPGSGAGSFNPQKNFTIQKIEPDSSKEEVRIFFSTPVPLEALRAGLRLLPRIKVDWDRCTVSPQGVLSLRGAFRYGSRHYVTLSEDVAAAGKTYVPTVTQFVMPDRHARVEFVEDKRVIERDSRQLLHVRTVNVKELYLESLRVPPLLLPQALAAEGGAQDPGQTLEQLKGAAEQLRTLTAGKSSYQPFLGEPQRENQLFPGEGAKNRLQAVSLPLSFRQDKGSGALMLIRVRDHREGSPAASDLRLFRLTDLGLTYKLGQQNLLLWVTSLKAGAPAAGVQVLAFTRGLEVFPLGVTDKDGILLISAQDREGLSLKQLGAFKPVKRRVAPDEFTFLMAGVSGDVSFLEVQPEGNLKPKDIRQVSAGEQPLNLKGQVFTERGVYRPGEKVFFKGTVRQYQDGAISSPRGEKCNFEVTNPRGESVFRREAQLSEFGTVAGEVATQAHWALGTYTLTMRFGPGVQAPATEEKEDYDDNEDEGPKKAAAKENEANVTFQVQEFRPPRHFTEIGFERVQRPDKSFVNRERQAEFVKIIVSGGYYAGGPVKHGQVRWKIHQARTDYRVPGYDGYIFGYAGKEQGDLIESGQAILDEQGKTTVEFPLDQNLTSGRQGLSVVATVVDFDGRAATSTRIFQADPDILVGVSHYPEKIQMGEPQDLKLVVVNRQGKKVSQGTLKAEVLQKSWAYVAKRNEQGDLYWDDETAWRKVQALDLPLKQGEGVFRFDSDQSGRFLLAFTYTDEKGCRFASASFLKVAWDYRADEKQERPYEPLGLWADRPAYKPGETASLTVSPKSAVAWYLVTLEREGIVSHQVVKAGAGPQSLPLALKAEYAPNVYVSVLGLKPRGDFPIYSGRYDTEAPGFLWGNLNLAVLKEPEGLVLKISPAVKELKAEPDTQVTLDLAVTSPQGQGVEAELALAVVDEAVLALTGFKTPSLDQLTRFDRPLRVFTGELRTALSHQTPFYPSRIDPLTGGGGLSGEMLSKLRKKFEAVAYFNPSLRTDAQGKAQVTFTLPDNITSYRIYAVMADRGSRFGNGERQLVAAKEFYLEPGLPAFFTRGDRFRFQVAAFNAGEKPGPVKFHAEGEGPLNLTAVDTTGQLPPKGSLKLNVTGEATAPGQAKARFGGVFRDKEDAVELTLRVNSGLVKDTTSLFGSFSGAGEAKVALPSYLAGVPEEKVNLEEVQAVITLSGSPFARLLRPIHYLLTYPYGCVEQTSSGVLGLAALRGLVQAGQIEGVDSAKLDRYLKAGIDRLFNLQTAQGGFGYWPGQRYPHAWGTIYAVSALSVAKAQGLPVWQPGLDKSLRFLKNRVLYQDSSPGEKAFVCYLLALNGTLDKEAYRRAKQAEPSMPREGKVLLLLAAKHAGLGSPGELKTALKGLLEGKEEVQVVRREDDFDARFRSQALALLAAQTIMPEDSLTRTAAQKLLGGLGRGGLWTSTSDTGWSLLALGNYFKGAVFGGEAAEVTVSQPGGESTTLTLDPKGSRSVALDARAFLKNPAVRLRGPAGGTWLYQVDFTAPRLDLVDKGVDRGFKITKTVKNTDGSEVIKVGDLVKVTLAVDVGRTQKYVVLDDPLPAGLVAVNSAFETEEPVPLRGDREDLEEAPFDYFTSDGAIRFRPNYFQIREDRVLAFRDVVYPGSYRYQYYARAVCEGTFAMPSSKVEAMYSPWVQGFSPQGQLTVKAR
jgi:uncharacterized protein YfaS (alpha-2-macroglobulin family)